MWKEDCESFAVLARVMGAVGGGNGGERVGMVMEEGEERRIGNRTVGAMEAGVVVGSGR